MPNLWLEARGPGTQIGGANLVEIPRLALLFSASPSANPAGPKERSLRSCVTCAQLGAGVLDATLATVARSARDATAALAQQLHHERMVLGDGRRDRPDRRDRARPRHQAPKRPASTGEQAATPSTTSTGASAGADHSHRRDASRIGTGTSATHNIRALAGLPGASSGSRVRGGGTRCLSGVGPGGRRADSPSRDGRPPDRRRRVEPSSQYAGRRGARDHVAQRTRRHGRGAPNDQALGGNQRRARRTDDPRHRTRVATEGRRCLEPFSHERSREARDQIA